MRKINILVVHCTASDNPDHDNLETIDKWHRERGWNSIGYNFLIVKDGGIHVGRPIEKIPAHAKGHNKNSIGICLTGDKKFSEEQFQSAANLIWMLMMSFKLEMKDIVAHNELNKHKTCPNFKLEEIIKRFPNR